MEHALKGVPVMTYTPPEGVINTGGEWYYTEFAYGKGVTSLGMEDATPAQAPVGTEATQPTEERNRILDLFRNNR